MKRAERTANAYKKQAEIIELRSRGVSNNAIAEQYGIVPSRATKLYQDGLRRIGEPIIALERARALEVRDLALRKLWTKEQDPPPSRVIQHPDGRVETVYDLDYHTRNMAEIRKWEEHSARLLGLYQASVDLKVDTSNAESNSRFVTALRGLLVGDGQPPVEVQSQVIAIDAQPAEEPVAEPVEASPVGALRNLILNGDSGS